MEVPKLYRISAEVERDQRERFRVFSRKQGRTMRAQLTYMVGDAIAGVELPKEEPKPAPAVSREREEESEPVDPVTEFVGMLQTGTPIPEAIRAVRELCAREGITGWKPPRQLHPAFVERYRISAAAQNRDADEALRALETAQLDGDRYRI